MAKRTCPRCKTGTLRPHCHDRHPTCTWFRCGACHSTIDLAGRRGWHEETGNFALP